MSRTVMGILSVGCVLAAAGPATAQETVVPSKYHAFRVVTVVDGLVRPWSIAFLPGGDMLVTEKPGRLRVVRDGRLLPDPVQGIPEVYTRGQAGLLDVVPHPDFASNRLLYLSYSKPVEGGAESTTAVVRGRFENDRLSDVEEIFEADSRGRGHYGSRLAFDGEGHLFITVGDRQAPPEGDLESHPAQDLSNHHGVVIRLHDDGRVPADNPFVGRDGARPEIWSYGHRNAQGLAIDPETGNVWITEHGPQGGDELNLILPGRNYGWPVIGYGVNYRSGLAIHEGTHRDGMEQPVHVWVPSLGVSGLIVYTGDRFPRWRGDLLAGGMVGEVLVRLRPTDARVNREEYLIYETGRVRHVQQGPDGLVYLAIDNDEEGETSPILRLEPAE
ncbi:MAG: PQQ-dependent sugar dehydrogenase, partial [Gemmatimonadetes bacterium]|nr:PQQ-dependent sugar dehydrogenase [Gemmatimonadota bacterium]NIR80544.1 PQQ-dependent sugar dehydrogenase [Gemmatimonadota bacterium]NIT86796.1 PQQ-dependent sugar dehydrogenase [Gemmatimonadota bacterium]NIU30666.1 PQQ-dependent sugar dehydrogenase [Gemmatimonadota bacterium]NIU37481.1 PQQ-dependent sugar dehydrogenase [Gemmatimonadota bacterium]